MTDVFTPQPVSATGDDLVQGITDYAIYRLDPDGIVLTWNTGAERLKGYAASEIIGNSYARFFMDEDVARGLPAAGLAIAARLGHHATEGWRVRKDGSRFWASVVIDRLQDASDQCCGFAKITRDITDSRIYQEALRQSEQRFRLLVDSVVHYAIFTLDPDGCVTSWNLGAERAKGYTRDEILGEPYARFFTDEDREAGQPEQTLAAARRDGRHEAEGWRVRKDGSRFLANIVVDLMHDRDGSFVGYATINRDITEKHALETAREQLYQSQKMESVGQLTGGIAHDFNNLLTAVSGSLALVMAASTDARVRRLIEVAQRAADRGGKLTHQLLAFSRRQILQPQTSNLNTLIMAFEILFRRAVGETINLHFALCQELWPSDIDPAQFQSAVLNLVMNARDAMPKGGALGIETRNVELSMADAIRVREIAPGRYVCVTVHDSGTGMTSEVRERAVEPFFTTKDVGAGSGLGLSQAYGFARQSEGQIEIESTPGTGTSVSLYLPHSNTIFVEEVEMDAPPVETSNGTILVVEDDPDVLEIAVAAVESFGYRALAARDGAEALSILLSEKPVDLLFTDVVMPKGLSGVDLARDARLLQPRIPVLMASGYPREAIQEREDNNENMAFIAKPYTLTALNEKLDVLTRQGAG
ncbi:hybrid sensor histidine kinase/response regulator [Lichenicoccus roseus]|uniref:histidine kinase n=1 Tax=Lichenicoccus roseus TaxID=2683649 RepID=A0A5R9JFQ8_9PROT|nr:PAS domain-containing sensor histidine kinase [Lichenicoccus roseus]TLU74246.1 PAS domain S-box protein [Lichenicoccus roseus]